MSVIITFPDGSDWFRAGWFFRQLAKDVVIAFPEKEKLHSRMEIASHIGGLQLQTLNYEELAETVEAIKFVARETVDGRIAGRKGTDPNDKQGQQMYIESMIELLQLISRQESQRRDATC